MENIVSQLCVMVGLMTFSNDREEKSRQRQVQFNEIASCVARFLHKEFFIFMAPWIHQCYDYLIILCHFRYFYNSRLGKILLVEFNGQSSSPVP